MGYSRVIRRGPSQFASYFGKFKLIESRERENSEVCHARPGSWKRFEVKDLTCQGLGDLSFDSEPICVKISLTNKKHAYVGAFYSPNSSLEALNGLDSSLSKLKMK